MTHVRSYLKYLIFTLFFYTIVVALFCCYLFFKKEFYLLADNNLLRHDALLYAKIKSEGYSGNWLCAFFPGFPFLWYISKLSTLGIASLNGLLFIATASFISCFKKSQMREVVFFLSIPTLVFMFVPYSEAIFFAGSTVLLFGLNHSRTRETFIGMFTTGIIRPTALVFIPAFIIASHKDLTDQRFFTKRALIPLAGSILGLAFTLLVHYYYTRNELAFFQAQKLWGNYLHIPSLPFTSWGGDFITRIDALALYLGILCSIIFLMQFRGRSFLSWTKDESFSLLYVIGTCMLISIYRGGSFFSLNRFIFATPFMYVLACAFFKRYEFTWRHVLFIFLTSELVWLSFNSYTHIMNFLAYSLLSIYLTLLLLTKHPNKKIANLSYGLIVFSNLMLFLIFMEKYLRGEWLA
jgi:hypothetical protein